MFFKYVLQIEIKVWADHADMISTQYTGTAALKTDITRTGRRSVVGMANDGINSMRRYIQTFQDEQRQVYSYLTETES